MGIFGNETDAVANWKPCGVGQGDLLIPMIAIHDKFSADGRLFEEDRVYPAPQNADFRLKEDRVAQSVRAWQNADRAASTPRDVIDRGLDHSICGADEVRLLLANCEGDALLPIRFDGISEDRSWIRVLRKLIGPRQHCAKRAGGQTAHGLQELPALKSPRFKWCHGLQVTSLPVSVIANSTGAGALLTCSTLLSVEQPSISEENESQSTQRGKAATKEVWARLQVVGCQLQVDC